jgi:hypothetical protein
VTTWLYVLLLLAVTSLRPDSRCFSGLCMFTGQSGGQFVKTGATIDWSAQSANLAFQSEVPNPARNLYSVIGHEQNGVFFHLEVDE